MKVKFLLPLIVISIVLTMLIIAQNKNDRTTKISSINPYPIVNLDLKSIYSGKNIVTNNIDTYLIHFFASWCHNCQNVNKRFLKMVNQDFKIPIFGVAVRDQQERVKQMLSKYPNIYNDVAIDTNGKIMFELGASIIPETILVKNNKIIAKFPGGINEAYF